MRKHLLVVLLVVALLLGGFMIPRKAVASCDPVRHVVRPGEYLAQIASRYGVTVASIVSANNIRNPNFIYSGQVLLIPVPCTQPPPSTSKCTATYVVKRGEYLKLIAIRYGTTVSVLVSMNNIRNPNIIYPGQRLKVPVKCEPAPKPTTPPPTLKNWKGEYWGNRLLSGNPKYVRYSDRVNFNWGTQGPGNGIGGTNFSARYTRTRWFDAGRYQFNAVVDDGVRVWVDGIKIIDEWHDSNPAHYKVVRQLSAGQHTLQIDYYQNQGSAQISFWPDQLDAVDAWNGVYYNNTSLTDPVVASRAYPAIDLNWGKNSPATGVTADFFSARFTGDFYFTGGTYQFIATSDDGIRVWVGDHLLIDQWHQTSPRTYRADMDLSEGNHSIKIEYFEAMGGAICKLRWIQK
jgi:LysM repeat protein